ncbi:MAG: hypothetical protein A3H43_02860 [Gammaproteobacteria bacterium RIFCSPLOWO2_02_FULL_42_9]|nr:MAG: hypothetical protein A3H43_02860 [Gammaproteobacteria bacterium RIFCSPLOWO2_02_FULL_42_9]
MATIQARTSRGHKYWYIVESKRVNGKPRPIVLAYLGKADDLLTRIHGISENIKLRSYSHGAIASLLKTANEFDICAIINKHIQSERKNTAKKPIRNNLTAGATFLLAAINRLCLPTSKQGFYDWAKNSSLEYLLKTNLSKVDSQHFWDLMDALPIENIERIEQDLLKRVFELYSLDKNSLFFDTTNFFTYIHTTNDRCTIVQRGRNKQKRNDLRQIGLALVVTQKDMIPLFHLTYEGNRHDSKIFQSIVEKLKERMAFLNLDIGHHTVVFDRGNNSKENLNLLKASGIHYVGALTPYQHKALVLDAIDRLEPIEVSEQTWQVYRIKKVIWEEERTIVVFISENLKAGQLGWIYQQIERAEKDLREIKDKTVNKPLSQKEKDAYESKITTLIHEKKLDEIISFSWNKVDDNGFRLDYIVEQEKIKNLEETLGIRILMTSRHDWRTEEIINAYHGQSHIEHSFKNMKNPYHLAIRPQLHWTDQKIKVHFFICVMGYLLAVLLWKQAKEKMGFTGSLDRLLDSLNNIRLGAVLEANTEKRGAVKTIYKLEEMSADEKNLMNALNIEKFHVSRPKLSGVSVYAS